MNKFELESRLIDFAAAIIELTETLPTNFACTHLGKQEIRSGTSPALNYGEAQAAESRADFIHKLKIVLKELKETHTCLRILQRKNYGESNKLIILISETNELISIFTASLKTAQSNQLKSK